MYPHPMEFYCLERPARSSVHTVIFFSFITIISFKCLAVPLKFLPVPILVLVPVPVSVPVLVNIVTSLF